MVKENLWLRSVFVICFWMLSTQTFSQDVGEADYHREQTRPQSKGDQVKAAEQLYVRGNELADQGRLGDALDHYDEAVRLKADFKEAYFARAGVREQLDDPHGALVDYETVLRIDDAMFEAHFSRALLYYKMKNYPLAIASFSHLMEMPLEETNAIYFKGADRGGKSGDSGITSMLTMYGRKGELYNYRGLARRSSGDLKGALKDFDQAIVLDKNNGDLYVNRGLAQLDLGDQAAAIADFQQALQYNPANDLALYNLAAVSGGNQMIEAYTDAIAENEDFPSAYINRGYYRFQKGDFKGAIKDYDQAIRLDDADANAFINRGIAKEKVDDLTGALADYTRAIEIDVDLAKSYASRAQVYFKQNQFKLALDDYSQAISLAPDQGNAYFNRALAYQKLGHADKTCTDLQEAIARGVTVAQKALEAYCK